MKRPRTTTGTCTAFLLGGLLLSLLHQRSEAYFAGRRSAYPSSTTSSSSSLITPPTSNSSPHLPYPPHEHPSSSILAERSRRRIMLLRSIRRLPPPLLASSDNNNNNSPSPSSTTGETEDQRRKRIMALQNEIAEDILLASEEEREAAEAAKRKLRMDARRAIYQAYNKVGGEVVISEIGLPKQKGSRSSGSTAIDSNKKFNRGKSFAARKFQLLFDSLWISALGLALMWAGFSFEASVSYALGSLLGFGYITLLGKTVEAVGAGPGEVRGAGAGQARFAMVILLVLIAGKYRDTIQVIPSIVGFSMYQVASLLQAFERDDKKSGVVVAAAEQVESSS